MNSAQARNCYQQSESHVEIHPVKLIHLMYERVLAHLAQTAEGVEKNDPKQRGENLGKAIAIIAELNASVKEEDNSDAAQFLRGLYGAILQELPKVTIDNDIKILDVAIGYVARLKDIWEQTAMLEAGLSPIKEQVSGQIPGGDEVFSGGHADKPKLVGGLSVSI